MRSQRKAAETAATIFAETGRSDISFELADLSLMSDTEALINRLIDANQKIDVLINNAGALFNEHSYTSEGLEQSMHYASSPWRLTEGLNLYSCHRKVVQTKLRNADHVKRHE